MEVYELLYGPIQTLSNANQSNDPNNGLRSISLSHGACCGPRSQSREERERNPEYSKKDESKFMNTISGDFEVKIIPAETGDPQLGMMLLDKKYLGDLEAIGKGRMLTGMTSIKDSAGYVAMERIEGTIKGRRGSFVIQHSGTMAKGKPTLLIHVVPDSGTGELAGLEGTMDIRIVDRKHFYDLRYTLPELESKSK